MTLFEKISNEKRHMILNAAYSCFGKNGYKKTSMADIADAADISKASLFQYFGTKKDMYIHLYYIATGKITDEISVESDDLFICIENAMKKKTKIMKEYPGLFEFLTSALNESDDEIKTYIKTINANHTNKSLTFFRENINWGKIKPGLDKEIIINIISWINEGYLCSVKHIDNPADAVSGLSKYLDFIKFAAYKEEYL